MDSGQVAKGAELSTAASVACNERRAAVGNAGHNKNVILRGLGQFGPQGQISLLWRDTIR